jgi:3'-5' exoribonuclease
MIKEFKAGTKIDRILLVRLQKIGNSSNGAAFARGLAEDNSGCIPFICFEAGTVDKLRAVTAPKPFRITGAVDINKFAGDMSLQLIVQKIQEVLPSDDVSHLMPKGDFDLEECEEKLQTQIGKIKDKGIRELVAYVLSGETYRQFKVNPAGMRLHHAYVGGLLQHSVAVAELAEAIAEKTKGANKDLILAGALLHDVGKLKEISSEMGFPFNTEGRLLGHITMTAIIVNEAAARFDNIDDIVLQQLLHIIVSHHGEQEKGSPIACATKESFIVHYADEIDAIMNQFKENGEPAAWEFNKMLQRFIYS